MTLLLRQSGEREAEGVPPPRVLVPGAGLGRLCLDLARLGFRVEVGVPAHLSTAPADPRERPGFRVGDCMRCQQSGRGKQ